ncbi:MAG: cyclopropane-fatty-acyl-phospholipid synthase family protein [Deltaproteobacteria bacterium]|nr:cyclopropane-fatty-acyl-phospholipid synthase family protein [Deltaproteobacteria bacterium]
MSLYSLGTSLIDRGWLPDSLVRLGIRRLLNSRLTMERQRSASNPDARHGEWAARLRNSPVAPAPREANEQHYEIPAEFYRLVLGPRLKYSSAYWPKGVSSLEDAELAMLELTTLRSEIEDGHRILDLGCGWGSLTLFLAERFPSSEILAISNSVSQGEAIRQEARKRNLFNLRHRVADVGQLELTERFDRVVSVEMFEHLRNYHQLLQRISGWLVDSGKLFVHIFCHRDLTYTFEDTGDHDWMARHFFAGGLMPAEDLLPKFQDHLLLEQRWRIGGKHYQRTCEAWLENLDRHRELAIPILADTYGASEAQRWLERWRVFFMACAELFGAQSGNEWRVAHYRFVRQQRSGP